MIYGLLCFNKTCSSKPVTGTGGGNLISVLHYSDYFKGAIGELVAIK